MTVLHAIALVLSVIRLTELVVVDTIWEPIRRRTGWYVWTCPRCVSVWTGLVATLLYIYFPFANWPFAVSALYILYAITIERIFRKEE